MAGSHAAWANGYQKHSAHDVSLITHPGQFWKWRMRGGAVTLADEIAGWVRQHGRPDVLLVSDMVDLSALLGLTRRTLGDTPVVLYLHENQLAFPRDDAADVDAAARTWASLVAADLVMVNSQFHKDVVIGGIDRFLSLAPDLPHHQWRDTVVEKMLVVPVGVDTASLIEAARPLRDGPPVILWNHRWDTDKQPQVFVRALQRLAHDGVAYKVILAGQDAWHDQSRLGEAVEALGDSVRHHGEATPEQYRDLLLGSDICVSVATHEFFGISVVEAMAAGCVPVLPNALSYPELVPPELHRAALYPDGEFRRRLARVASDLETHRDVTTGLRASMTRFDWSVVAPMMDAEMSTVFSNLQP